MRSGFEEAGAKPRKSCMYGSLRVCCKFDELNIRPTKRSLRSSGRAHDTDDTILSRSSTPF
jgi:hypothetical protein